MRKIIFLVGFVMAGVIAAAIAGAFWYQWAILPVSTSKSEVRVQIESGASVNSIAAQLENAKLIRSQYAFRIYCQLNLRDGDTLQSGTFVLAPSQTVSEMVASLTHGKSGEFNVTIPPGLRLDQISRVLVAAGFSQTEVDEAFAATYDKPILRDRPAGADLEGYLFPETYRISVDSTAKQFVARMLDEHYSVLQSNGLVQAFSQRGLTIHQGLTLASIVQKEDGNAANERQIAQVFLLRIQRGMMLGSDVTFIYAAHKLGVEPGVSIDSPYNTRLYKGLPPGPISNMTLSAMSAVADPAQGDYLYFVAGDDGKTYFSRTVEEHEANVAAHCKTLCS